MKNYYVKLEEKRYCWDCNKGIKTKKIMITAHNEKEVEAIVMCFWNDWKVTEIKEFTPELARIICHPADVNKIEDF